MGKWFKQFETLVWAASMAVGSLIFMYASFATKEYVDLKHQTAIEVLKDIQKRIIVIDERTYELAKDK